jgi:stage IV sporulation protein FB
MVLMKSALGGIPVSAAMMTTFETVAPGDTLEHVSRLILSGSQQDFPVLDGKQVVGVVTRSGLLKALAQKDDLAVSEIMHRDVATADASDMLESALQRLQTSGCPTLPVVHNQKLVGLFTAENLGEFVMIKNARSGRKTVVLGVNEATVGAGTLSGRV